jgi:tryptophan 2,3-dioxygenase
MSVNGKTRSLLDGGGGCPAGYGKPRKESEKEKTDSAEPERVNEQDGINMMVETNGLSYGKYLQLDKILNAQTCQSELHGQLVHDEHLFIVIHQAYELWFKQVIFEIDSIRTIFEQEKIEEAQMLEVNKRLQRVVMIVKLLADQVLILETMTPLDFMDFRDHLSTASGFQSLQFRLMENKLGVKSEHRVRYNKNNYRDVYKSKEKELEQLIKSEEEPSLFDLIERWLMRTPGLDVHDDFCFSTRYQDAINKMLEATLKDIETETNPRVREVLLSSYKKKKEQYSTIFDKEKHNSLTARGERRFAFEAMHGALMISLYR